MKILFCTDGSKISFDGLKNISAWTKDAIVDVISVIDWSFLPDNIVVEADGFFTRCASVADDILDYAKSKVEDSGLLFGKKFKQCGCVVDSIMEQAENGSYDLILLGSHGKKGFQQWLGSVSREISYGEKLSTYVSKNETKGEKILFATDGSESADYAIEKALELFDLENKKIYICTVNESADVLFLDGKVDYNWILDIEHRQEVYSQSTLQKLERRFKCKRLSIQNSMILQGNPSKKILDYALEQEIDLIVAGSRGNSKMKNFLLGSVSKRILENAKCDVVIFK